MDKKAIPLSRRRSDAGAGIGKIATVICEAAKIEAGSKKEIKRISGGGGFGTSLFAEKKKGRT